MAVPAGGLVLMPRWLYGLSLRCLLPIAVLVFWWRGRRDARCRGSLRERLALGLVARSDRPLWLHAASVGETQALLPLLRAFAAAGRPSLLTVGTPTGVAHARVLYADLLAPRAGAAPQLALQAAPWDLPGAATRFMRAVRPSAAIFVETELWPNLVAAARNSGAALALVSGRVSQRSADRYLRFAPLLLADTVRALRMIGAQSAADRERFIRLGAAEAAVVVTGNLKFDFTAPAGLLERGASLRSHWAPDRPMWVAGSTHPDDEEVCVAAQRQLVDRAVQANRPAPLLVLAPRRPERFATVVQWLATHAPGSARVSTSSGAGRAKCDVLLLDTMGELQAWYAAADVAFVGGTLAPVGGHNLIEPAALGKPVLAGPHCFNAPDVAQQLACGGGLQRVHDVGELVAALTALLGDAARARAMGGQAAAVVDRGRGAAARTLEMLRALPVD
jgi:3-deoxy-D-manno-octulosonic-acid transferase